MQRFCVLLAGGRGERFFPLSTHKIPKPFIKLKDNVSLFQQSLQRLNKLFSQICVVLSREHLTVAREQCEGINVDFIVEPHACDTAAAISLACLQLHKKNTYSPKVVAVFPADHYIEDAGAFVSTIKKALDVVAARDCVVTIGIKPTHAETRFGYIKKTQRISDGVFEVECFVEKPDTVTAQEFIKSSNYYWNAGIFIFRLESMLDFIKIHLPQHWQVINKIPLIEEEYRQLPKISIDYGVMEKIKNIVVVEGDFGWDDVGTWLSLERLFPADEFGNVTVGKHVGLETKNCIIFSQGAIVTTYGIENLIISYSNGKLLICTKDKADKLKELVHMCQLTDE